MEGAVIGEDEVGFEGEDFGADTGQVTLRRGVNVGAGGGEEDERFLLEAYQGGDDVAELLFVHRMVR